MNPLIASLSQKKHAMLGLSWTIVRRHSSLRYVIDSILRVSSDNARPEIGIDQRRISRIIGLRNFNNWIKSVLITRFAHTALVSSTVVDGAGGRGGRGSLRGKVLDMGCGKGGDLNKWSKARIKEYVALGISLLLSDLICSLTGVLVTRRRCNLS
jgi:hypothetical protein